MADVFKNKKMKQHRIKEVLLSFFMLCIFFSAKSQSYFKVPINQNGVEECYNSVYNSLGKMDFILFPNPNSGKFNIQLNEYWYNENITIDIINFQGQIVFFSQKKLIEKAPFSISIKKVPGIYLIKITGQKSIVHKKILIK